MLQRPTPVVTNLIIINVLVFLLWNLLGSASPVAMQYLEEYFVLWKIDLVWYRNYNGEFLFKPVQLISWFFSQQDFGHLFFNLLGIYVLGTPLEMVIGQKRFLSYYLFCGIMAGLLVAIFDPHANPVLGASGAIYGLMIGLVAYFPDWKLNLLFPPVSIPAKYLGAIMYFYSGYQVFYGPINSPVSHFGHFMGAVAGILYFLVDKQLLKRRK